MALSGPYYKAVRMDGTDFWSGTTRYAGRNKTVQHPDGPDGDIDLADPTTYLSLAKTPAGVFEWIDNDPDSDRELWERIPHMWPCRVLEVEVDEADESHTQLVGTRELTVVRELPGWTSLGPRGLEVASMIERVGQLSEEQVLALASKESRKAWRSSLPKPAVRDAVKALAWDSGRTAAVEFARTAGTSAFFAQCKKYEERADSPLTVAGTLEACQSIHPAIEAEVLRDILSIKEYDHLTTPWRSVI